MISGDGGSSVGITCVTAALRTGEPSRNILGVLRNSITFTSGHVRWAIMDSLCPFLLLNTGGLLTALVYCYMYLAKVYRKEFEVVCLDTCMPPPATSGDGHLQIRFSALRDSQ